MIVWNLLFATSLNAQIFVIGAMISTRLLAYDTVLLAATTLYYPIVGILTDSCIGRHKTLIHRVNIRLLLVKGTVGLSKVQANKKGAFSTF